MFSSLKRGYSGALAGGGVFGKHLMVLIAFLLMGNLSAVADCWHFAGNGNNKVINHPSYDRPYLRFTAMYYDATSGNNGYFVLQKPTKSGSIPASAPNGPALFINGQYACSPINEFGWNDNDGGAWKACGNDSWWGNTYYATIDGIKYTIKFYNPYHDGDSKRVYVHVVIFPSALPYAQPTTVTIAGMWKMNKAQKTPVEESFTWSFNGLNTMGVSSPTAVTYDYKNIKISGNLKAGYGQNTVGTFNGATNTNISWKQKLTTSASYNSSLTSFNGQTMDFSWRTDYYNDVRTYVEYIISRTGYSPAEFDALPNGEKMSMNYYMWYAVTVPGYMRAKGLQASTSNIWNKEVNLTWETEGRDGDGTWSIYRYEGTELKNPKLVKDGIEKGLRSYTVVNPSYDKDYTYEVSFIPRNGSRRDELSTHVVSNLGREWSFSNFKADTNEDGDKIILKWNHTPIGDANSKSYTLQIQRSTDYDVNNPQKATWQNIKDITINSANTNSGTYTDQEGLTANHNYFYRLVVSVLDTDMMSPVVNKKLGGSKVLSFQATRGSYNNMVKLKWTVKQVGSNVTNFIIQRRPLGSNDENAWAEIYSTSGTASGYSYDDITALPGTYNQYKVVVWSQDGKEVSYDDSDVADGFCLSTGTLSGNIKYGTGTAVAGAKVVLKQQGADGEVSSGMHSVRFTGVGTGFKYDCNREVLQNLFGKDFSIQLYINPDSTTMNGTERYQMLDVIYSMTFFVKYDQEAKLYHPGAYIGNIAKSDSYFADLDIVPGEWTHLTLSHKAGAYTAISITRGDSIISDTLCYNDYNARVNLDPQINSEAKCISFANNATFNGAHFFNGYMDEFRFFTRALSAQEILKNYNHPLTGNEKDLAIYYPFDEGLTSQNLVYDYSRTNNVSNGRHGLSMIPAVGSTYIPNEDQLSLMAYTDSLGYYEIRGIPYSGEGTSYSVIPKMGIHEFSPVAKSRFISQASLIHNGVDFDDISSFPVSGKIFYSGTDYPVEGANLYVDGVICASNGKVVESAEDGTFTISVPIGDHYIEVVKSGHVFANGRYPADPEGRGVKFTFDRAVSGLEFRDTTLVNYTGRVVGGDIEGDKPVGFGLSVNNIGVTQLVLTPLNDLYRLNVVKQKRGETSFSYETNTKTAPVASASGHINSKAWRGAGTDDCRKIVILTDSLTGEFSAMLPPLQYKVSAPVVVATDSVLGDSKESALADLSQPLASYKDSVQTRDGVYEYYEYNTMYRKVYHSAPIFTVVQSDHADGAFGISEYEVLDAQGTIVVNDIYDPYPTPQYKYGGALFVMSDTYTFNLSGREEYRNYDASIWDPVVSTVPLAGTVVTIDNALSSEQAVYMEGNTDGQEAGSVYNLKSNQLVLDSLGLATYVWKAGYPNICDPYTRTISISYDIDNRTYHWNDGTPITGIVLGSLPTGNNFITAGPDLLDMVLRDPPGTKSKTEWTSGTVTSVSHSTGSVWNSENSVETKTKLGAEVQTATGIGVAIIEDLKSKVDLTVGAKVTVEGEDASTWSRSVTATRTISTSDEAEYVGAQGDVFIGSSTNIIFGMARNVGLTRVPGTISDVELSLNDIMTTGLSFGTEFAYTQNYIENVLIPNLEKLRNGMLHTVGSMPDYENTGKYPVYVTVCTPDNPAYGSSNHDKDIWGKSATAGPSASGPSYRMVVPKGSDETYTDSVEWCNTQIRNWKKHLANNEMEKVRAAALAKAKSDSVTVTNLSFDSGSSITCTKETEDKYGHTYENTVSAAAIIGGATGFFINSVGVEFEIKTETGGGEKVQREFEESQTASFSYTLAEEGDDDALTVDVYEYGKFGPIFRTRGGQTCGPYEGKVVTKYYKPGTTIMDATMQIEVPQINVDVPVVSDVPSGGLANYVLRLSNASEIDEDVYYRLLVNDETNPDGANLMIDGKPITDSRIVKVPAGTTVTKALQLKQTDASVLDYNDIEIVLASQCQYDPTSTWDVIADTVRVSAHFVPSSSPVDLDLSSTVINTQTGNNLRLSFSGFDRNYRGLKAFRLQYKKQGAIDWTLIHEYVVNKTDLVNGNEMLPSSGTSVSYDLEMKSFPDGDYLFRVVSVSTYGKSEVYRYSDEIALVKDTERPRSMGQPEPTDGVLDIGDELSISFNEDIIKGRITKESNFIVTGVLNGAKVQHETALSLQGGTDAQPVAYTDASVNLARKDFSIDAWIKVNSYGTLLTHGQGSQKLTVAITQSTKLKVSMAGHNYISTKEIPTDKWVFLTMSLTKDGVLNASVAVDDSIISLYAGRKAVVYEGNGPLRVGQGLNAAIHELLLWDEAHDMTTALLNRSVTKSPSTRHLIGYWKMNEGEGTSIRDYSRNRHMTMSGENWYINNENKSVSLDGQHVLSINASALPVTTADDYVVEFWMCGGKQQSDAQLLQMGEIAFWINADGQLQLTGKGAYLPKADANCQYAIAGTDLDDNAWHHVALSVLRQGAAIVYVDGVRRLTVSESKVGNIVTNNLIVGARRTTVSAELGVYEFDRAFTGMVDEVRVWNATMNGDMIVSNRNLRFTGSESGLVAYYPFELKGLDGFNQVVTTGSARDLCDSLMTASLIKIADGSAASMSYVDNAPALRLKPTETNVNFSYTASNDKIVITIDEDPAAIEGCTLNFTVRDLYDNNGNSSVAAIWSAFVNRNELVWQDDVISVEQQVKDNTEFAATIENLGGQQQMWAISGLPSWLTASADYGVTNPRSKSVITFRVSPSTPIGKYEETVYLKGNNGIETPLTVNVKVKGQTPEWSINPRQFENSMNMIATLDILGIQSEDEDDIVAAFIDDECRGMAHPSYNERYGTYYVTMDIYGNADAGKPVSFRAFDASTGTLYPEVEPDADITFQLLELNGTYSNPVKLTAHDKIEQTLKLKEGWNWVSIYVVPDNPTIASVAEKIADNVEIIKSQNAYLAHENGTWGGNLTSLGMGQMYAVKMKRDCNLRIVGSRIETVSTPIVLYKGWNWTAYYGRQVSTLADALADINPEDGDMVKAQSGVAYYDRYEWVGSLQMLEPGQGYKIRSTTDDARTFKYPGSVSALAPARGSANGGVQSIFQPVDFHAFADNLTMAVKVLKSGQILKNVVLGIFADGECRAAAVTDENGMAYLTVPGDKSVKLTLKVAQGADITELKGNLDYVSDAILGTPQHPLMLDLDSPTGIDLTGATVQEGVAFDILGREIPDASDHQGLIIINNSKRLNR